ncbi:MAG: hypothetical protein ACREIA_21205 [Opitutaceae bacterium]
MRVITSLLTLLFLAALPGALARDGELLVQGMLVVASNKTVPTDEKLAPYEPNLKNALRQESFRSAGEGSAALAMPGVSTLSLSDRHRLEIEGLRANQNVVRLRVKWFDGKTELLNTTLRILRGTPAILAGPKTGDGDEIYAILVLVL